MRNRKAFIGVSAVILAVIAVVLALRPSKGGVTQEHFELLKPGMPQAEVEHLLYGPPRNDLRYPAIIWLPQATGKRISAEIAPVSPAVELFGREEIPMNGRPGISVTPAVDFFPRETPKSGHQAVWITRTGLIAVYFGQDGGLLHKYSSTVHEPVPPSVMSWVSRPRLIRQ